MDDETTMTNARVVYVRFPDVMAIDRTDPLLSIHPELPEHLHSDIVNLSITLMIGDITPDPSKRIQLEAEQS